MVEEEMNVSRICQIPKPKDVLFPQLRKMSDARLLCNKLKGHITVVESAKEQEELIKRCYRTMVNQVIDWQLGLDHQMLLLTVKLNVNLLIFSRRFLGRMDMTDTEREGFFTNVTGADLDDGLDFWFAGEPNGERMENCKYKLSLIQCLLLMI
jgi:hypothetical protein